MVNMWDQIARELPYLRQVAADGMTDQLHCERPTGRTVRIDGKTVPEMTSVWSGLGKVQVKQTYPSEVQRGGGTATLTISEVHVAFDEPFAFRIDDVFVVERSEDPQLVGRRYRYRSDPAKTWRTARRFNCEEVTQ